jgi:hypothetical protein
MGLRFHKKIKLLPGLHLNISKQGISLSGGINGATVNLGKGGLTGTASAWVFRISENQPSMSVREILERN